MPDGGGPPQSEAAILAAWTGLTADRFGDIYTSVRDRERSKPWQVLEANFEDTGSDAAESARALIRLASEEAARTGFLDRLACAVGWIEMERSGRPAREVGELLNEVGATGILQAMTNRARGLMSTAIFPMLLSASQACAIVYAAGAQVGTAFLVRSDLVLTAAHVVLDVENSFSRVPYWKNELRPGLTFSFEATPSDPSKTRVAVAAASSGALVAFSPPHGTPPRNLHPSLAPPAGSRLDYALVRLARQVEHVRALDITKPGKIAREEQCFVMGFPGGDALMFDADIITDVDASAGRLLHVANAIEGMSGGCCIGREGSIIGLHEGALSWLTPEGGTQLKNRGIDMQIIRRMQCAAGKDPLAYRPTAPGLEMSDSSLVEGLYRNGLRLAGPRLETKWRAITQKFLGLDAPPGDGVAMPSFHPWLRRRHVEDWIDNRTRGRRLCHVHGQEGAGKSFCVHILRSKLNNPTLDLFTVNATQTTAWSWNDAIGGALPGKRADVRGTSAKVRYDDIPTLIDHLAHIASRRRTIEQPLFVAIDFEAATSARIAGSEWQTFITSLAREDWARLMLIGLSPGDRDELNDALSLDELTREIDPENLELAALESEDIAQFIRSLSVARGHPVTTGEARKKATDVWTQPWLLHSERPAIQTAEAALTAFVVARTL